MQGLSSFVVREGFLHTLPPSFKSLFRNLTVLNLSYNNFHVIPPALGDLVNLTELDLGNNFISNITLLSGLAGMFPGCISRF